MEMFVVVMIEQWQFVRLEDLIYSHACWRLAIVPLSLPFDGYRHVINLYSNKDVRKKRKKRGVYINFLACSSGLLNFIRIIFQRYDISIQ